MSSFLCFLCHSTVNADTNEDTRDKYREVVGMNLCPDSHLCFICCHFLNKMWLFKSICLKRSLEYPVLFSEKGTINLQRSDIQVAILCPEDICIQHLNTRYHFHNNSENSQSDCDENNYVQLQDDRNFDMSDNLLKTEPSDDCHNDDYIFCKVNEENLFYNEELLMPNLEPVKITHKEMVTSDHWLRNDTGKNDRSKILELNTFKSEITIEENVPCSNNGKQDIISNNCTETENQLNDCREQENLLNTCTKQEILLANYDVPFIDATNDITDDPYVSTDTDKEESSSEDQNSELDKDFSPCKTFKLETDTTEASEIKERKKYTKADFRRLTLSLKKQKMDLAARRKSEKYLAAEYKCYNCADSFLFKESYQAHMMRHEESNGEYRCSLCTLRFASPGVLRKHTKNHANRYKCSTCGTIVRCLQRKTHLRLCRGAKPRGVACHFCGGRFLGDSHLKQHIKRSHQEKASNRSHLCNVCGKSFSNQAAVRTHMITHINRKFPCDQCPSTFSSPYTLNQHKKKHATIEQELHYCDTCKIGYNSRKSLLAHKRNALVHKESIYKCPVCWRPCASLRALHSHTAAVHARTKHLVCASCPNSYSTRKALVRHMLTHKEGAPKKTPLCHACGESFKSTSALKRHLKNVCEKDKLEEELTSYYEQ